MSQVVSIRLRENQMERLRRIARRIGRTPSETSALLVEEGLRRNEFGYIDFRESPAGRQAYVLGMSLAVWEVILVARSHQMDAEAAARHLHWPLVKVQAALNYATAFPEEIGTALEDNGTTDFDALVRMLPEAVRFVVQQEHA